MVVEEAEGVVGAAAAEGADAADLVVPRVHSKFLASPIYKANNSSSSSSNTGGRTQHGSGPQPAYGRGGKTYAGGAAAPYTAGRRSPGGLAPFLLPATALAFFPGIWLFGIYAYPYERPYHYMNQTSNKNESIPVVCVCQEYSECGCDNNHNKAYFKDLFGGVVPTNTSKVRVGDFNGTEKVYINGTLPNGTTLADQNASNSAPTLLQASGYWVPAAIVASAVWLL